MDSEVIEIPLREQAFDLLPVPAIVVDRSGVVELINDSMLGRIRELSGRSADAGDPITALFARDKEYLMTDLRSAAGGGRLITWLRDASEDASTRMCFRVVVIPRNAKYPRHYLLTEDKFNSFGRVFTELNNRLRRAHEDAAEKHRKNLQLKENYKLLEQFSLVAAHDLKAPLLNIALLLEFLQEEYGAILDGPGQDLIVGAKESAERLQQLISALLSHARSGAADLRYRVIDIHDAVVAAKKLIAVELRETGGQIQICEDLGKVRADPDLFGQLLQNILSNALQYRSYKRAPNIRISRVSSADGSDSLIISDNGIGFDPSDKDRLFQPFARLSASARGTGSGVGLAICRTICDRHGWTIDATGSPDVGATFEISGLSRSLNEGFRPARPPGGPGISARAG